MAPRRPKTAKPKTQISGNNLLLPVELRQAMLSFFQMPSVIAPSNMVLQIVQALTNLPPAVDVPEGSD